MKLIVLFVGVCVSVGVLCSVPDQVEVGSAHSSYSGDVLAPSNNQTSIRNRRTPPILVDLGALILPGGVSVAAQNSIVNEMDERFKRHTSVSVPLDAVNRLMYDFYEEYDNKNILCRRRPNRPRRQPSQFNCPLPGQNYFNEVERIAAELRDWQNAITTDVSNDNTHAVSNYTTIEAPANQYHAESIDLTVTMRATLTYDNTAQNRRAPSIHHSIAQRLQEMDWYRGGNRYTNDEQGHLLADSLGGPSLPWNFVPQSPSVNRAVSIAGSLHATYCWWDLEGYIRDILREHQDHYIAWTIVIGYGMLPYSRRPTGFMISVREMTFNHQFVSYRLFMIPNVPSDACNNPNHPFWQLQ